MTWFTGYLMLIRTGLVNTPNNNILVFFPLPMALEYGE
jgi:hypothetical protein